MILRPRMRGFDSVHLLLPRSLVELTCEILLIDYLVSLHEGKFGDAAGHQPQAALERAEEPLRAALRAGDVKSVLINGNFDRSGIPPSRWTSDEFWDLAHSSPFDWEGDCWTIVLDPDDLGTVPSSVQSLRREQAWIDQAPEVIKNVLIYRYLRLLMQFLPFVNDHARDLQWKRLSRLMEENGVEGWSDLTGREQKTFFKLANEPSDRPMIAKKAQKETAAKRKASRATGK